MLKNPFCSALLKKKITILINVKFLLIPIVLFFLINSLFFPTLVSAHKITNDDKTKASFVFNFIRFIKWPADKLIKTSEPINVCVINRNRSNSPFIKAFKPFIAKLVNGHPLTLHKISNPEKIQHCHLIYIDKLEKNNLKILSPLIIKHHILSVSDIDNFCTTGGIIGLVKRKGKIRVKINLQAAQAFGYSISSNLLEMATIVSKP
jgi:YfiR/HmsC-like